MKRVLALLTVALVMAAMMLVNALPAFAAGPETGSCAQNLVRGEDTPQNPGQEISTICVKL
jgi:hypothetical protein